MACRRLAEAYQTPQELQRPAPHCPPLPHSPLLSQQVLLQLQHLHLRRCLWGRRLEWALLQRRAHPPRPLRCAWRRRFDCLSRLPASRVA